jgi:transcription elongation factor GreA
MTDQMFHITAARKDELTEELRIRKEENRTDILQKLQFAKSLGDLSENAEYHAAREAQGKNESRIKELEHILKNFVLVEKSNDGSIQLGSQVSLIKQDTGTAKEYTIVGVAEADMANGKLSNESPLGEALIGKRQGDDVTIETPKGTVVYTIQDVT